MNYSGPGLTLDAKLQQNPTTYLTAKGYVPMALFKGGVTAAERAKAHGTTVAAGDRIDLHVESTPIDLGLVQGFTTPLSKVTGTLQAKIDITGSAADPHPKGEVTIDKAAFTVEPTGVAYSNLKGKIELQEDKVHIDNITVLDNHQSALSITGDLAIHELELGGVELFVNSNDFKVIDNKLGNVRVNANLEIAGELRSPRIVGDFGLSTGSVDLDQILAFTSDSAYATEQTEYLAKAEAAATPAAPSPLDALTMDVRVTVPDDLVVKASELRTPGAPVSLGAINLTLGGDLRATKARGAADRAGRGGQHRARHLRLSGPPLRHPARRQRPVRRRPAERPRPDSRRAHQPDDSGGRGARQRARHAEAARHRAHQHAAARAGGHSLADRVQPADQLARRRTAGLAGAAGAADGHRRTGGRAGLVGRQRARGRHLRDQHRAGQRRGRLA